MYHSNITHFLNPHGNIVKDMPKEALEMAAFLTFIIEATTDFESEAGFETEVGCLNKECQGIIQSRLLLEVDNEIYWWCPVCGEEGKITEWEGSQWDGSAI